MRRAGDTYRRTGPERQTGKRRRDDIPIDDSRMRPRFSRRAPKLNYPANSEPRMRNERERWGNSEYNRTGANRAGRSYTDHVRTRRDAFISERPRIGDQDLHRAQNWWRNPEAGGARSKRAETSRVNPNRAHTNRGDVQFPATEVFVSRTVDQATARVDGVNKPAKQHKKADRAVKQLLPAAGKSASSTAKKRGLRIATVCANNMNRSMATHLILKNSGFNVQSFGTATQVCSPIVWSIVVSIKEFRPCMQGSQVQRASAFTAGSLAVGQWERSRISVWNPVL